MPPGSAGATTSLASRWRRRGRWIAARRRAGGVWNTYIWVESADDTVSKVLAAGGRVVTDPFDVSEAGRMAVFTDPEGAAFCVWQADEHRGHRWSTCPAR